MGDETHFVVSAQKTSVLVCSKTTCPQSVLPPVSLHAHHVVAGTSTFTWGNLPSMIVKRFPIPQTMWRVGTELTSVLFALVRTLHHRHTNRTKSFLPRLRTRGMQTKRL